MAIRNSAFSAALREPIPELSQRSFYKVTTSEAWNLIWEAGPYYEKVAQALEDARSYAVFVGWQVDSRLELSTKRHETLRETVIRLCTQKPDFHIYFLMWDHAYFYALEREYMQGWVWENVHERVHFIFDNRHPYWGSHHEKLVIVDGETAFVGSVDICDDRWDTPRHLYNDGGRSLTHDHEDHQPYHDMAVEVRGEAAADLVEHIGLRWRSLSSTQFPERPRVAISEGRGKYRLLLSRTRAEVAHELPLLIRENEFLFRDLIRSVQRHLVIENQYFWSTKVTEDLISLMRDRAGSGLNIFFVVPAPGNGSIGFRIMGIVQTKLMARLMKVAEETKTNFVVGCPFVKSPLSDSEKSIYVHSKLLIVDDRYLAVGSCNFNNRGFRLDTELTLTLIGDTDASRASIREYAERIVGHWGASAYASFYERPAPVPMVLGERSVYLKPYFESWEKYLRSFEARAAKKASVFQIIDPITPFTYFLKRRLAIVSQQRLDRVLPLVICGAFLLSLGASLLGVAIVGRIFGGFGLPTGLTESLAVYLTYAFFLSTSWFFPLPTLFTSVCAGAQLGLEAGSLLVFSSLIVSSAVGYFFSRVFPTAASRFCRKTAPQWVSFTFGLRRLPILLRVAVHPFVSFRSKIAYSGIFSLPVRWFALMGCALAVMHAAVAYASGLFEARHLLLDGDTLSFFIGYLILMFTLVGYRLKRLDD